MQSAFLTDSYGARHSLRAILQAGAKKPVFLVLKLLLLFLLVMPAMAQETAAGDAQAPMPANNSRLQVVASFSILGDMVHEIGGDYINLDVIVGPLSDAHTFEPSPRDARAMGSARVLFVNGLDFESWMPRLIESSGFDGSLVVVSNGIQPLPADENHTHGADHAHDGGNEDHGHDHGAGLYDPHAWQDLANGVIYVQNIAMGLAQADPAHASAYYARADAYIRKLRLADAKWRRDLAAIPPAQRVAATSHQAFAYFGSAYDIKILSVVGPSSEAEPSARAMADLVRQIREQHIRALFPEQGGNMRALQQIANETGVPLGEALFADTLARPGHKASTYLGMFQWNTGQLLQAFNAAPAEAPGTAGAPDAGPGE